MSYDKTSIKENLKQLRKEMKQENIDICIITNNDYHQSEYASDYFFVLEFFSGFNGSNGTLIIDRKKAYLYTDGRYFVQAKNQLKDTSIELKKMGIDSPILTFIKEIAYEIFLEKKEVARIGLEKECISKDFGETFDLCEYTKMVEFKPAKNIWKNRGEQAFKKIYRISEKYVGKSAYKKIEEVRKKMQEVGATSHIISSLDDIAYLTNLRGGDVLNNPVFYAFLLITQKETFLFANKNSIDREIEKYLNDEKIYLKDYTEIYEYLEKKAEKETFLIDKERINYRTYEILKKCETIEKTNPSVLLKSIKNDVEISNIKDVHIDDGTSLVKLMYFLKKHNFNEVITELDVAKKVDEFRSEIEDFKMPSFTTISAYGKNAAMLHYSANEETNTNLLNEKMILIDSGGQYLRGTTDVTRTFSLGNPTKEEKHLYTLVLKALINLSLAKFLEGTNGSQLDMLARSVIWKENIDYRSGTGHGVGYFLNVHEGPNAFRVRAVDGDEGSIRVGMVTTNEPGIYLENECGIRLENEMLTVEDVENEWGKFLKFEQLTLVPFDKDLIEKELLYKEEIEFLNSYHKVVYEKLSNRLSEEERKFLKEVTKEI